MVKQSRHTHTTIGALLSGNPSSALLYQPISTMVQPSSPLYMHNACFSQFSINTSLSFFRSSRFAFLFELQQQENRKMEGNVGRKKWSKTEDLMLCFYIAMHGEGNWDAMARTLDIGRSGSSCRHRWNNELSLEARLGDFSDEEKLRILELHLKWGNSWSRIAKQFPGRTDNEIKNLWNSQLTRKAVELGHIVGSREFLQYMRPRVQAAARGGGGGSATTAVDSSLTTTSIAASGDCEAILREIEAHLMREN